METITSLLAILGGLLLRLAIPVTITAGLITLLRKLDARWQVEAQLPVLVENRNAGRSKAVRLNRSKTASASSPLPCWQAYRLPNGYLREECLSCQSLWTHPCPH
jgi:hypothetical protein